MRQFGLAALCGQPIGDEITTRDADVTCPVCLGVAARSGAAHVAALCPSKLPWYREAEHRWLYVLAHRDPKVRAMAPESLRRRFCAERGGMPERAMRQR